MDKITLVTFETFYLHICIISPYCSLIVFSS